MIKKRLGLARRSVIGSAKSYPTLLCLGLGLSILPMSGHAEEMSIAAADPAEQGSLSPAEAAALRSHRRLPVSDADVAAKAAADRAHAELERSGALQPARPFELDAAVGAGSGPVSPATPVIGSVAGQSDPNHRPSDSTGAIGPTRYIQTVNNVAAIYSRSGAVIGSGTLNQLAGRPSTVSSFDPQVIWDSGTGRFYYVMQSVVSLSPTIDKRLSWGFSKTSEPSNFTTDWCHYNIPVLNQRTADVPKLGQSVWFSIIGVNIIAGKKFEGAALYAIGKPRGGTTCPAGSDFKTGTKRDLRDTNTNQVASPVPAVQVDARAIGYVVARERVLPSDRLWIFNVTQGTTGSPVFGAARGVPVASFNVPPSATQPGFNQLLDTGDASLTNAVGAFHPDRGTFSLWTQHTIANGSGGSNVRFYEINPVPLTPVVLRTRELLGGPCFVFNAAISPDRAVNRFGVGSFGNSFVIEFNGSCRLFNLNPSINAGSPVNGGAVSSVFVIDGVGPYRDRGCPNPGDLCRWGDYSGASPDPNPRPSPRGVGAVWGTSMFSGVPNPDTAHTGNWRTRIFEVRP